MRIRWIRIRIRIRNTASIIVMLTSTCPACGSFKTLISTRQRVSATASIQIELYPTKERILATALVLREIFFIDKSTVILRVLFQNTIQNLSKNLCLLLVLYSMPIVCSSRATPTVSQENLRYFQKSEFTQQVSVFFAKIMSRCVTIISRILACQELSHFYREAKLIKESYLVIYSDKTVTRFLPHDGWALEKVALAHNMTY
jgi:hypothetical protein